MSRLLLFLLAILTTSAVAVTPEELQSLDLERAVAMAYEASEDIALSDNEIEKARLYRRQALGGALPNISAEAKWSNFIEAPNFNGLSLNGKYETLGAVSVSQAIYNFGALSSALRAAKEGEKAGRLSREAALKEVEFATRLTYYTCLLASRQLEIAKASLKNAEQNLKILQDSFSQGRPPQGDLIQLKTDVASRRPTVLEAEAQLREAILALKQLLGVDYQTEIKLSTDFSESFPSYQREKLQKGLGAQPKLLALKANIELQSQLAEVESAKSLPSLGAFLSLQRNMQSQSGIFSADRTLNTAVWGVQLKWNLWDGGTTSAKYRTAVAERGAAEITHRREEEKAELDLAKNLSQYQTWRQVYTDNKTALQLARESFRLSQNRFKSGKTSVTELNTVNRGLTQVELSTAVSLFKIHEAMANLRRMTGLEVNP